MKYNLIKNKTFKYLTRLIPTWTLIKLTSPYLQKSTIENLFVSTILLIGEYTLLENSKKDCRLK